MRKNTYIMTERELSDYLRDLVESLGTIEITSKFITERNLKKSEFQHSDNNRKFAKKNDRNEETRLVNADCILLETLLIQEGKVLPPTNMLNDFGVNIYRIDNKDLQGPYYYPKMTNINWMQDGITSCDLTHLMFTRMYRPVKNKPLKAGDKVKFEFLKLINAKIVFDNLEDYIKEDGKVVKRYRVL